MLQIRLNIRETTTLITLFVWHSYTVKTGQLSHETVCDLMLHFKLYQPI